MATMTINVNAKVNQPPSIGDGSRSTDHGVVVTFTRADFTTNTTPAYSDPEGDAPLNLKVISLPAEGTLKLNGVAVVINQVIPFTDIDGGLLTYTPNNANTTDYNAGFDFQISDAGSQTYVS